MKRFGIIGSITAVLVTTALYLAGCKQGLGERCQVAADCSDGLVCAQATQTCQETTGGGIDATTPIDAAPDSNIDADIDAPIDSNLDAPRD